MKSPPKFGIKPTNPKIMFLKYEIDQKEALDEKLKQIQFKEHLEFSNDINLFNYCFYSSQIYEKNKSNIFSSPQLTKTGKFHKPLDNSFLENSNFNLLSHLDDSNNFKVF